MYSKDRHNHAFCVSNSSGLRHHPNEYNILQASCREQFAAWPNCSPSHYEVVVCKITWDAGTCLPHCRNRATQDQHSPCEVPDMPFQRLVLVFRRCLCRWHVMGFPCLYPWLIQPFCDRISLIMEQQQAWLSSPVPITCLWWRILIWSWHMQSRLWSDTPSKHDVL